MGLRTIMWKYDTDDWMIGEGQATKAQIDANYQDVINSASNGSFSSVCIAVSIASDNALIRDVVSNPRLAQSYWHTK